MIEFLSTWAKSLGLSIIVISILEMILPNNKTKKYVRMIFGIYIIFNIISPFIKNKDILDVSTYNLEAYSNYMTSENANEISADNTIEQIYIQELENDITDKINDLGYKVISCNVYATFSSQQEESNIEKIELNVEKEESTEDETIENKLVNEIQKIKPINTTIETKKTEETEQSISNKDIQEIKKFLIEEYGVDEKCLRIN